METKRPYVICHMVTSIDGKVTGNFLYTPTAVQSAEIYYDVHRNFHADAFACGRVTMEGSFTGGWFPDLTAYEGAAIPKTDFVAETDTKLFAVSFDRKGRLGWKQPKITDDDPGYDNAHIIEVLTTEVGSEYLAYLQDTGISYLFADSISEALEKLYSLFDIKTLLLEGGSDINGAFMAEQLVDELSLVQTTVIAGTDSKPLFGQSIQINAARTDCQSYDDGTLWLRYQIHNGTGAR